MMCERAGPNMAIFPQLTQCVQHFAAQRGLHPNPVGESCMR
jgi:hypothetical protein